VALGYAYASRGRLWGFSEMTFYFIFGVVSALLAPLIDDREVALATLLLMVATHAFILGLLWC